MDSVISAAAAAASQGDNGLLLTGLVAQLWSHMNVALAKSVKESVEPIFKETLPHPLSTLRFTKLDLGTVPIRMDNIVVHDRTGDSVQFDSDIVWDGDCSIELKADYIGSFGVDSVKLKGRMSVLLSPLIETLPVVSAVQYGFINAPHLELDFTGLAQIADFQMIDGMIRGIIQGVLASMLVLPNRMLSKLDPANCFLDTYKPPIGVARVTVVNGNGFQAESNSLFQDVDDVYCKLKLGQKEYRTTTKNNTADPEWNETFDFLVFDHDQIISVHAWDADTGGLNGDDDLGSAQVTVGEMLLTGKIKTLEMHGGCLKGSMVTLHCDMCSLTSDLNSVDSNEDENLLSGLVTILVIGAFDIPLDKKDASCFVKVKYGTDKEFVTGTVADAPGVDALNPVYDSVFHVPLTPTTEKGPIEFQLIQGPDIVLGISFVTHEDLVDATHRTITAKCQIGEDGASLKYRIVLQGVEPADALVSRTDSVSAGTSDNAMVRLTVEKGWGFEVERRRLRKRDIPDVYCTITFGSSPSIFRTTTIRDCKTPEWNESKDYVLSDHGQVISITVFDEDRKGEDDELGSARISVGKLLLAAGSKDVELFDAGKPTGHYVSLRCDMVS